MNSDLQEFADVVRAHQDAVYGLALATVRDPDDAADIAQEAFVRLWRRRDEVAAKAHRPWLMKVTRNLCLDHLRRRTRDLRRMGPHDPEALDRVPAPADPESILPDDFDRALGALSPRARSLVSLHYGQGFKLDEIAAMLGMTTGAVKVALHRARRTLRQSLAPARTLAGHGQENGS